MFRQTNRNGILNEVNVQQCMRLCTTYIWPSSVKEWLCVLRSCLDRWLFFQSWCYDNFPCIRWLKWFIYIPSCEKHLSEIFWGLWAAAAASAVQKKHILGGFSSFHLGRKLVSYHCHRLPSCSYSFYLSIFIYFLLKDLLSEIPWSSCPHRRTKNKSMEVQVI